MPVGRDRVYTGVHVRADFRLERSDIRKLAQSTHMRNLVVDIARKRAMPHAKKISAEFSDGEYVKSFRVVSRYVTKTDKTGRYPMKRISSRLLNLARHATVVEVGRNGHNDHWVFRRTLQHLQATSGGGVP